jgi:hypothetical protein
VLTLGFLLPPPFLPPRQAIGRGVIRIGELCTGALVVIAYLVFTRDLPRAGACTTSSFQYVSELQDEGEQARRMNKQARSVCWFGVVLAVCAGILSYAPAVSPYLHSDDFVLVNWGRLDTSSGELRWFDMGIGRAWSFRPLVLAILGIIYAIVGLSGYLYHTVQVVIHLMVSLLVGMMCCRTSDSTKGCTRVAGLVTAIVFLWPLSHEAVMWVSAIAYPLAAALGLLALALWDRGVPSARRYVASVAAFAAALLAHPFAAAWFAAIAVSAATAIRQKTETPKRGLLALLPYAVLIVVDLVFFGPSGAGRPWTGYTVTNTLPLYARAGARLLAELLWLPGGFLAASSVRWSTWWAVFALAVLAASVSYMLRRPGRFRLGWAGLALATATAAMTIVLFPGPVTSSRYLYLPTVGLALMGGNILAVAHNERQVISRRSDLASLLLVFSFLSLAVASNRRYASLWAQAGQIIWRIRDEALERVSECSASNGRLAFYALPDHLGSAYVLRHGLPELIAMLSQGCTTSATTALPARSEVLEGRNFIWLGEETGFVEFGPGADTRLYHTGLAPDGLITHQDIDLDLPPGLWCLSAFARGCPALGQQAEMKISLNGEPLAVLTVTMDLQPYSVSLSLSQGSNILTVTHTNDFYDEQRGIVRTLHVPLVIAYRPTGPCMVPIVSGGNG